MTEKTFEEKLNEKTIWTSEDYKIWICSHCFKQLLETDMGQRCKFCNERTYNIDCKKKVLLLDKSVLISDVEKMIKNIKWTDVTFQDLFTEDYNPKLRDSLVLGKTMNVIEKFYLQKLSSLKGGK